MGLHSWESDLLLIVEGATWLEEARPDVTLRVYLAKDLETLCPDLVNAGCEVFLMALASQGHCPGAMWKFLALEENDRLVTVVEAHFCGVIEGNILRTEETVRADLGAWRMPGGVQRGHEGYLPIRPCHFGSVGGYPVKELMERFVRGTLSGSIPRSGRLGGEPMLLAHPEWPHSGFEGWFLLAVMYPRMVEKGFATFVSLDTQASNHTMLLDVEYTMWANPGSELIFYRESAGRNADGPDETQSENGARNRVPIRIRKGGEVILRARPSRKAEFHLVHPDLEEIAIAEYEGTACGLIEWALDHSSADWWIDMDRALIPKRSGAELCMDRYLERADVAVCGWHFISLTLADAEWAVSHGADGRRWIEGAALKVPKIHGPITLWKPVSAGGLLAAWRRENEPMEIELFLEWMRETGQMEVMQLSTSSQGWQTK